MISYLIQNQIKRKIWPKSNQMQKIVRMTRVYCLEMTDAIKRIVKNYETIQRRNESRVCSDCI